MGATSAFGMLSHQLQENQVLLHPLHTFLNKPASAFQERPSGSRRRVELTGRRAGMASPSPTRAVRDMRIITREAGAGGPGQRRQMRQAEECEEVSGPCWCSGVFLLGLWRNLSSNQMLDGNNRIEIELDGMGSRVLAVGRKTNDTSKRIDSTVERMHRFDAKKLDIRRRPDAPLSFAALSSRPTVSLGPNDSASTTRTAAPSILGTDRPDEMEGLAISFTGFPPNSDKIEIKRHIVDMVFRSEKRSTENFFFPREIPGVVLSSSVGWRAITTGHVEHHLTHQGFSKTRPSALRR